MATGGGVEKEEIDHQRILRITDVAQEPLETLLPIEGYENMPPVPLEEAVKKLVHLLPRVQNYTYVAKRRCKNLTNGLTQDESASIMLYTMESDPVDKCLYFVLNATLRARDRQKLKPWFLYLRLLLNAFSRLPSISQTTIFRGVKLDLSKQYVMGDIIEWWGFSSCTSNITVLESELFLGKTGVRTMFSIECLNGKDISKHSYHASEDEILLLPATQFKVLGSLDQGDLKIIHLREIIPEVLLLQPVSTSAECNPVSSLYNSIQLIYRKAINDRGQIGSLYDAYQDRIVESSYINLDLKENQPHPTVECRNVRGDEIECQNLLQFMGFDDELRLSLLSNIVSPSGIALVMEYPYLIDERTRILYYSYAIREECPTNYFDNIRKQIEKSKSKNIGTHIITGIDIGIEIIVLLRLTSNQPKLIDTILNNVKEFLVNGTKLSNNISLDEILSTYIYSNIDYLTEKKTLIDFCSRIHQIKNDISSYRPSNYILCPIETILQDKNVNCVKYYPLKTTIGQKIEQHFSGFLRINKMGITKFDDNELNLIEKYLKEQSKEVEQQSSKLREIYKKVNQQLKKSILDLRHEKSLKTNFENEILNENYETTIKTHTDDFIFSLSSLNENIYFIKDLHKRGFHYQNAHYYHIQQNDNLQTIQQKLTENNQNGRFLCSNDTLNNNKDSSILEQLCSQLYKEKKLNQNLTLIYVDFTYSTYELDQITIFPLINNKIDTNQRNSLFEITTNPSYVHSQHDKTIYILLLGKSGVGKSTLINNFINYLKFKKYDNIQSNKSPLHVIISYVHCFKSDFEEHFVRIGSNDSNEDFNHPDQSTTQQCKLYYFNLDKDQKLCIIDTPGFGKKDDNDDIIMQQILSHIIDLNHLDAICVLIQSNEVQLDSYYNCLNKLFHCFGNDIINNFIFLFTKTLSNPQNLNKINDLTKSMIETLPKPNKPFNKENILQFDSSFFIDSTTSNRFTLSSFFNNQTSNQSWQLSKDQWNHLIHHIKQNLNSFYFQNKITNPDLFIIEINQLVRPLLETLRNDFRNFILLKNNYPNSFIQLEPIDNKYLSAICRSCRPNHDQYGPFFITYHYVHQFRNRCYTCLCSSNKHFTIDYQLKYEYSYKKDLPRLNDREHILEIILHLSSFITNQNPMKSYDPFLFYLNQMINEEGFICQQISHHKFHLLLYNFLRNFKQDYEKQLQKIKQKKDFDIKKIIEIAQNIPMVKIQLDAARKIETINT